MGSLTETAREMGHGLHGAHLEMESLARVAEGGTGAVQGLALGFRGLAMAASAGMWGAIALGLTAVIELIGTFTEKARAAKEEQAQIAAEAEQSRAKIEETVTEAEKMEEPALKWKTALEDANTALNQSLAAAKQIAEAEERLARAQEQLAIAKIKGDSSLSPEQKAKLIGEQEAAFTAQTAKDKQDQYQADIEGEQKRVANAKAAADQAAQETEARKRVMEEDQKDQEAAVAKRAAALDMLSQYRKPVTAADVIDRDHPEMAGRVFTSNDPAYQAFEKQAAAETAKMDEARKQAAEYLAKNYDKTGALNDYNPAVSLSQKESTALDKTPAVGSDVAKAAKETEDATNTYKTAAKAFQDHKDELVKIEADANSKIATIRKQAALDAQAAQAEQEAKERDGASEAKQKAVEAAKEAARKADEAAKEKQRKQIEELEAAARLAQNQAEAPGATRETFTEALNRRQKAMEQEASLADANNPKKAAIDKANVDQEIANERARLEQREDRGKGKSDQPEDPAAEMEDVISGARGLASEPWTDNKALAAALDKAEAALSRGDKAGAESMNPRIIALLEVIAQKSTNSVDKQTAAGLEARLSHVESMVANNRIQ
jgi:hypothetical protein